MQQGYSTDLSWKLKSTRELDLKRELASMQVLGLIQELDLAQTSWT